MSRKSRNGKPERRKRILVDRDLHLRLVLRLGGALLLYLVGFEVIIMAAPYLLRWGGMAPEGAGAGSVLNPGTLLQIIMAPLLCSFLCLFAYGVLETFRIAGPNYRFQKVFGDLETLRIPRGVRIRKRDHLQETARAFDRALVALHDELATLKRDGQEAVQALESVALPGDDPRLAQARDAVRRLDRSLGRFTLLTCAPECQPVESAAVPVLPLAEATTADS